MIGGLAVVYESLNDYASCIISLCKLACVSGLCGPWIVLFVFNTNQTTAKGTKRSETRLCGYIG